MSFVPLAKGIGVSTSLYRIAAAAVRGRAVITNTAPTTSYRAAGRPEVMYIIERLIDKDPRALTTSIVSVAFRADGKQVSWMSETGAFGTVAVQ